MSTKALSRVRKSILPTGDDTWATIAERELGDRPVEKGVSDLQSWNLHVFMRAPAPETSPRAGRQILPSDVIFIEPPLASA